MRLKGKIAIITGGMRGIGLATAKEFVGEGARVLLVDLDENILKQVVTDLGEKNAAYYAGDISLPATNQAMVTKALDQFGRIDILFANAGIGGTPTTLLELSEEDFDRMMNINVKSVWLGMKATVPHLISGGGGSVIITSSLAGLMGAPKTGVYSASKHAVIGLMKTAAAEWARFNINVNTINPGPIETDMVRDLERSISRSDPDKGKMFLIQNIPFRRYGLPEEVARLALFLSEDGSRYISGHVHKIDGAMSAF